MSLTPSCVVRSLTRADRGAAPGRRSARGGGGRACACRRRRASVARRGPGRRRPSRASSDNVEHEVNRFDHPERCCDERLRRFVVESARSRLDFGHPRVQSVRQPLHPAADTLGGYCTCHVQLVARPRPRRHRRARSARSSRRQLLAGAGTAVRRRPAARRHRRQPGIGGRGCAPRRHGGRLLASTPAAAASGTVTFGSNYSDEVPKAAFQAMIDGLGNPDIDVKINTVDHNTFQENINTYLQQPDDVISLVRRLSHARLRRPRACVGDISDVWADLTDFSEGFKSASTGLRRQAVLRARLLLPVGRPLPEEPVRGEGLHDPDDVGRADGAGRPDEDRRAHPVRVRQRRQVAADGHVRHAQHAHQRLRLPRRPDGRQGETGPTTRSRTSSRQWTRAPALPPGGRQRPHVAGRRHGARRQGGRHVSCSARSSRSNFDRTQQTSSTTSTSSRSRRSTTSYGQDSIEAPIDGFMMAASPKNEEGAKALLAGLGTADARSTRTSPSNPSGRRRQQRRRHVGLQRAADRSRPSSSARRSTSPSSSTATPTPTSPPTSIGDALADFIADPSSIDSILSDVEEQKQTYTFE